MNSADARTIDVRRVFAFLSPPVFDMDSLKSNCELDDP